MNQDRQPPQLLLRFFRWFCHPDYVEDIEGDLLERLNARVEAKGKRRANWFFFLEVFRLFRTQLIRSNPLEFLPLSKAYQSMMLATIRRMKREKGYALINTLGLTLGFTVVSLTQLYTAFERSYDSYIPNNHEVYRLEEKWTRNGETEQWAAIKAYLSPAMNRDYAGVRSTRLFKPYRKGMFRVGEKIFAPDHILYADSTFLEVFQWEVLVGSETGLLSEATSIVLTKSIAERFFGDEDPLGQVLEYRNRTFRVSGVIKDLPKNAHMKCEVLLPLSFNIRRWSERNLNDNNLYTYIRTGGVAMEDLSNQINKQLKHIEGYQHDLKSAGISCEIIPVPTADIHLEGKSEKQLAENGDQIAVDVIQSIGWFILIMSAFNYINLATSRQFNRSQEVAVRKVLGSDQLLIALQSFMETFLFCLLATGLSSLLTFLTVPYFNHFFDLTIANDLTGLLENVRQISIIALSIALISGIYPAFKLATIHPLRSLKLNAFYFTPTNKGKGWFSMRNMLTCIQLMVSAFTILCILIISKQLNFIENKDLGIDTNGLIVTPVHRSLDTEELELFKSKLYENSQINSASTSHTFPGRRFPFLTFKFPNLNRSGLVQPTEQDGSIWMRTLIGDHDVINTFGLDVVKGRDFTKRYASGDDPMEFIINEAAAEFLGLSDPVGETVVFTYDVEVPLEGKVIGVVEDFNYASLHNQIEPVIIFPSDRYQMYLSISFNSIQSNRAIRHTEEVWREQMGNVPFRYSILDDEFKSHYRSESHLKTLLSWLTIISILIAVVGLIGMSFYSMEKRKYEVGIRKVLGASVNSILRLNLKEYIRLALISNVLIIPVVVFFGRSWLDNFAYSVDLDLPLFVSGFVISFFVVLASVSFNVLKSTFANPTEMIDHR